MHIYICIVCIYIYICIYIHVQLYNVVHIMFANINICNYIVIYYVRVCIYIYIARHLCILVCIFSIIHINLTIQYIYIYLVCICIYIYIHSIWLNLLWDKMSHIGLPGLRQFGLWYWGWRLGSALQAPLTDFAGNLASGDGMLGNPGQNVFIWLHIITRWFIYEFNLHI